MVEKDFNKKYGYSVILGISTFLIAILVFFFGVSPLYKTSIAKNQEYNTKKTTLAKLETKKTKLEELKGQEEQLTKDAETVKKALPDQKEIGRIFIQFDQLVKNATGSVNSVSESGGTTAGATSAIGSGLQKSTFTVPVTLPNYFKMKDLIASTESALRIMSIDSVDVGANNTGGINLNLSVSTYMGK